MFRMSLLAVAVSSVLTQGVFASTFEEGLDLMRTNVTQRGVGVDLEKVYQPAQRLTDAEGNVYLSYTQKVGQYSVFGEKKLLVYPSSQKARIQNLVDLRGLSAKDLEFVAQATQPVAEPKLSTEQASIIAIRDLRQNFATVSQPLPEHLQRASELVMYRDSQGNLRLVHHLTLPGMLMMRETAFDYFIDAQSGEIVDKVAQLYDIAGQGIDLTQNKVHHFEVESDKDGARLEDKARKLNVYNGSAGKFSTDADANWDRIGETRKENQRAEVELYLNMGRTIDYFKNEHGFIWKEGKAPVQATAHVNENFNNAYYSSWQGGFFFGDGSGDDKGFDYLTKGLDVAAHEYTHGVIDLWCPLTYNGESGALNEHIADFFGAMVDADEWQMGDNISIGSNPPLRDMQDPTRGMGDLITEGMKYAQWAELGKKHNFKGRIYPDRVSKKIICNGWGEDNGGVHINSSIFNKFAYLATTGQEIESEGLGHDLMSRIYMRILKNRMLSSRASFTEFRDRFIAASELHLADHAKKDAYLATIKKAFARIDL